MIKFFRKIRYDIMGKNKTGKYLKYAIGEIILVVIGILIAIQLNEWRNENTRNQQKQKVLKALRLEFQSNLSQLDTILYYNNKTQDTYPKAIKLVNNQNVTKETFNDAVLSLGYTWSFSPINGALRSGISSGEIHLINNDRLIELLFSWEDIVEDSKEEIQKLKKYQYDSQPIFDKYIRIVDTWKPYFPGTIQSNFPSDYSGFVKDVSFEDYVNYSFFNAYEYATELNIIKINNLEILKLIDQELEK